MLGLLQTLPGLAGEVRLRDQERVLVHLPALLPPPGDGVDHLHWCDVTALAQPQVERAGLYDDHIGRHHV